jgi:hypothetical protein
MDSFSANETLQLRVQLHGIQLGRPVDILLDLEQSHVLGFVVRCGDESQRFLPFAASQRLADEIAVASALMLLEDVGFYRERATSFRSLLDGEVQGGELRDLSFDATGAVTTLRIEREGEPVEIPSAGALVVPTRAAA